MIARIPGFEDIFEGEKPSYDHLISTIPSKVIIGFCCMINGILYLNPNSPESQKKALEFTFRRFDKKTRDQLIPKLNLFSNYNNGLLLIYSPQYLLEFIQRELSHFRDFEIIDTTPEQEVKVFKAYLMIVEEVNKRVKLESRDPKDKLEFFRMNFWKIILTQFDFQKNDDIRYSFIKSIALFEFLSHHPRTSEPIKNFLLKSGKKNYLEYVFSIVNLFKAAYETKPNGDSYFSLNDDPYYSKLLNYLAIDPEKFGKNKRDTSDFIGLRTKPLIKWNNNLFLVTNWSYLIDKLDIGLQFDLFGNSKMKKEFKVFPEFRKFIGLHFSEGFFVSKIISACLGQAKYTSLIFDEKENDCSSDIYYREGNNIFLFEVKDNLMAAEVVESYSYDKIIADVHSKFVRNDKGKKKGVNQLKDEILNLGKNCLSEDNFIEKGKKRRNLIIHPIIIYMDKRYGLNGIDQYLDGILKEELLKEDMPFKKIEQLIVINFKWFIANFKELSNDKKLFGKKIKQYSSIIKKRGLKVLSDGDVNNLSYAFPKIDELEELGNTFIPEKVIGKIAEIIKIK